jgi:hypothetical protein
LALGPSQNPPLSAVVQKRTNAGAVGLSAKCQKRGLSLALPVALEGMKRFYEPDLTSNPDSPFIRDGNSKLVRRSYWMDMDDRTFVMVMTKGIGAHLTNDEKRAHLADLRREHLIDQICVQEILPPER